MSSADLLFGAPPFWVISMTIRVRLLDDLRGAIGSPPSHSFAFGFVVLSGGAKFAFYAVDCSGRFVDLALGSADCGPLTLAVGAG